MGYYPPHLLLESYLNCPYIWTQLIFFDKNIYRHIQTYTDIYRHIYIYKHMYRFMHRYM